MLGSFKTNEVAAVPELVNCDIVFCVCVRTALLLFCWLVICKVLNTKETDFTQKKKQTSPLPTQCVQQPNKHLQGQGFLVGFSWFWLWVQRRARASWINTLLPQCLCAYLLFAQHRNNSVLTISLPNDFTVALGHRFWSCRRAHLGLQHITSPQALAPALCSRHCCWLSFVLVIFHFPSLITSLYLLQVSILPGISGETAPYYSSHQVLTDTQRRHTSRGRESSNFHLSPCSLGLKDNSTGLAWLPGHVDSQNRLKPHQPGVQS